MGEDVARDAWNAAGPRPHRYRDLPSEQDLEAFGQRLHANIILLGRVDWHTRSIWVDLGPKTVSTAQADAYVFDVAAGHIVYKREDEQGFRANFPIDEFVRYCLLNGLDDIGLTLQHEHEIAAYEARHPMPSRVNWNSTVKER